MWLTGGPASAVAKPARAPSATAVRAAGVAWLGLGATWICAVPPVIRLGVMTLALGSVEWV